MIEKYITFRELGNLIKYSVENVKCDMNLDGFRSDRLSSSQCDFFNSDSICRDGD